MAPEVLDGKTLDFAATFFPWGSCCTRWQPAVALLGKEPARSVQAHCRGPFADPRTVSAVSDHLAKVIARSLARDPNEPLSAIELMLDDLRV